MLAMHVLNVDLIPFQLQKLQNTLHALPFKTNKQTNPKRLWYKAIAFSFYKVIHDLGIHTKNKLIILCSEILIYWHIPWLFLSDPAESQWADHPLAARIPWTLQLGVVSGPVHPLPLEDPVVFQEHHLSSFANQQTVDSAYPTQLWPHPLAFGGV